MLSRAKYRPIQPAFITWLAAALYGSSALAIAPDDPGPAAIQFTLNSDENVRSISRWIYGSNSTNIVNRTFDRSGGNRMTGYNWENNASNAGRDWYNHSDYGLANNQSNAPPGSAVRGMIQSANSAGRASLVTVPIAGYVAADGNGTVDESEIAPSPRWKEVVAKKSTVYPGSSLSSNPDKTDAYVFTDEFVHWAENFKDSSQPLWYSLDNEPGLWGEELPDGWQSGVEPNPCCNPANGIYPSEGGRTHPTIHPFAPTFVEMRDKTVAHASAIKDVNPNTLVFGGVGYGWNEFTTMQDAPDAVTSPSHPGGDQSGEMHYNEYLLQQVRNEEIAQGRKLMDVLDLHWYPEAQGGGVRITENNNSSAVVAARVQAPRSLWDPTYAENSWISQWGTWVGSPGNFGPITLLPRVQRDIDDFNPGTKIAITEYNYGGGNHISGAVAQADVLGIFGREGVFAASLWELGGGTSFINGAFNMYLDYDGAGGEFGDTAVDADTSSIADSAIYASVDSSDPNRMVVVAINRTGSDQTTGIAVTHDRVFDHAEVYQLTSASANPTRAGDVELDLLNAFQYTMPAYSVTTLVLISDGLPGDFNRDGTVSAADYTVWRNSLGQTGNTDADANEDDVVDLDDYAMWKSNFGRSEIAGSGGITAVPEPPAIVLAFLASCGVMWPVAHRKSNPRRPHTASQSPAPA
jgi:hypothetical protein